MEEQTYLVHHGVQGQKWGVRRYQNANGSLTSAGKKRYYDKYGNFTTDKKSKREFMKGLYKDYAKTTKGVKRESYAKYKEDKKKVIHEFRLAKRNRKNSGESIDKIRNSMIKGLLKAESNYNKARDKNRLSFEKKYGKEGTAMLERKRRNRSIGAKVAAALLIPGAGLEYIPAIKGLRMENAYKKYRNKYGSDK